LFKKKKGADPRKIDTLIGKDTSMTGTLDAKGTIRIDGSFEGKVSSQSDVIIGGNASVKANVKGKNVTLAGKLEGDVDVENKLEILNKGALHGDIKTGLLTVEEGGYFTGLCNMTDNGKKPFNPTQKKYTQQENIDSEENEKENQEAVTSGSSSSSMDNKVESNVPEEKGKGKGKGKGKEIQGKQSGKK